MAQMLIQQIASPTYTPAKYKDEVQDRMRELIEKKIDGQEITAPIPSPDGPGRRPHGGAQGESRRGRRTRGHGERADVRRGAQRATRAAAREVGTERREPPLVQAEGGLDAVAQAREEADAAADRRPRRPQQGRWIDRAPRRLGWHRRQDHAGRSSQRRDAGARPRPLGQRPRGVRRRPAAPAHQPADGFHFRRIASRISS